MDQTRFGPRSCCLTLTLADREDGKTIPANLKGRGGWFAWGRGLKRPRVCRQAAEKGFACVAPRPPAAPGIALALAESVGTVPRRRSRAGGPVPTYRTASLHLPQPPAKTLSAAHRSIRTRLFPPAEINRVHISGSLTSRTHSERRADLRERRRRRGELKQTPVTPQALMEARDGASQVIKGEFREHQI